MPFDKESQHHSTKSEVPTQHKDYDMMKHTNQLTFMPHSHHTVQNQIHQNTHGIISLRNSAPISMYSKSLGDKLNQSQSSLKTTEPKPQLPKGNIGNSKTRKMSDHNSQLIQMPQNLRNNHTSTDSPHIVYQEKQGIPVDFGLHNNSAHPDNLFASII